MQNESNVRPTLSLVSGMMRDVTSAAETDRDSKVRLSESNQSTSNPSLSQSAAGVGADQLKDTWNFSVGGMSVGGEPDVPSPFMSRSTSDSDSPSTLVSNITEWEESDVTPTTSLRQRTYSRTPTLRTRTTSIIGPLQLSYVSSTPPKAADVAVVGIGIAPLLPRIDDSEYKQESNQAQSASNVPAAASGQNVTQQ